jgi:hypothetical protein
VFFGTPEGGQSQSPAVPSVTHDPLEYSRLIINDIKKNSEINASQFLDNSEYFSYFIFLGWDENEFTWYVGHNLSIAPASDDGR